MYVGLAVIVLLAAVYLYMRLRPVQGLAFIDMKTYCEKTEKEPVQIVDVRDPVDYERGHLADSHNIYIGRLPYVNLKELRQDVDIVITASSRSHIHRAARILKKSGYDRVYGLRWQSEWKDCKGSPCNPCSV